MSKKAELTFEQTIEASPTAVYYALTNGAAMREWLCTNSQVDTREGGRIYLWWQQGYHATGEFLQLVPNERIVYSWQGRNETAVSTVTITLAPTNNSTQITLVHSNLPTADAATELHNELRKGWETGLENLKSVLETGLDKRLYDQPFLGILISGQVNAEQAAELGIDAAGGIRISGTMPGTGAAEAGLQNEDIIVDMGGSVTKDFPTLQTAIRPYRPGDAVKVTYYRAGERQQTVMTLSTRPIPTIPDTPAALAAALKEIHADLDRQLDDVLANVTEAAADYRPDKGGWNAKEILAHLITTERGVQMGAATQITNGVLDGFPNNPAAWVKAVTAAYPTLAEMVALWKRTEVESAALLANLPEELVARKATYQGIGNGFLNGLPGHTRSHIAEIKSLLAAGKTKLPNG